LTLAELRCEQITASYPGSGPVLSGVDLTVADGTVTAILGSSGSGKTTLLRVVMGFIAQDRGVVTVGEKVVSDGAGTHLPPEKRAIGYVAQEGALYPHLTVQQNVSFGLARSERKLGARARELLSLVGLDPAYLDRRPGQLSGGEQRRVALARALAPSPPVVVLDEPFSGLDAALRTETREAVLRALAARGTTAVLVTHDQAEALSTGREVAVLRSGLLVQTAPPSELYRMPADLEVAGFVGDAIVLPGVARAGVVKTALGDLQLMDPRIEGRVSAMIRPEQIELRSGPARAKVVGLTFYGPDTVVELALDGAAEAITARVLGGHDAPSIGTSTELGVHGAVMAYRKSAGSNPNPAPGAPVGERA
jgi:iron(III) transport system ATP-binding protein